MYLEKEAKVIADYIKDFRYIRRGGACRLPSMFSAHRNNLLLVNDCRYSLTAAR